MEDRTDIAKLYDILCEFPEDIHKNKETFYIYSHIDDVIAEKYAANREEFQSVFSLQSCLELPDWARDAVVRKYKKHGLMKKMFSEFSQYMSDRHIGGDGGLYTEYGTILVKDNVCMENLAVCISNLALKGEELEYMGDELPRWIEESENLHECVYEYTIKTEDSDEITIQNYIDVFKDNRIVVHAGVPIELSGESEASVKEYIERMNATDFPVLLKLLETEEQDHWIFEISYEIDKGNVYYILSEEERSFAARDEAFAHVVFGLSYNSIMNVLPGLLNVLDGIHTPEKEVMLFEADKDEGYHYETPNEARYYFEHRILRDVFFNDPAALLEELLEGGADTLYDNFRQRCERRKIECIYKKEDFKVFPKTVDNKEIVRIVMPLPKNERDCFEINMVVSRIVFEDDIDAGILPYYFTVERGADSKTRFLCEWNEREYHYNRGECPASVSETMKRILSFVN